MSDTPRSTRYSSLSLKEIVSLCGGSSNEEAWEEFVARVGGPLKLMIRHTACLWGSTSRFVVEDLLQATYLRLWEGGIQRLREFAINHPESIWSYLKKTAANTTHDYFRHGHSQTSGGNQPHVSTSDVEPEVDGEVQGSQEKIAHGLLMHEIDELLKACLSGPERERDRAIFWLYFRQGMSTKEIASLPTIGLSAKGVGSVIERLKCSVRDQLLAGRPESNKRKEIMRK